MEKSLTYSTANLLIDYEQYLNGFRFMTPEKIEAYIDYVKQFIDDVKEFFPAENLLDSLASIARYDHIYGTNYANFTLDTLNDVHFDNVLNRGEDKNYFDRRSALAKLDSFIVSDDFKAKVNDVSPASETLIGNIRMWGIVKSAIHNEISSMKDEILDEIKPHTAKQSMLD
ncbi:MAG: hypothetical protein IK092_01680 [Muribaculaceae bacterium]|nr:hypothetical protein [Muribaculaceae bacterium]